MVIPEEIESVNILCDPFSALYAGNSFGGVISIARRMQEKFEPHASAQFFTQNFELYGTDKTFNDNHQTATVGDKVNDLSVLLSVDRLENTSQPMQFANATSTSTAAGVRTLVTGTYSDKDLSNLNRTTFGATGIEHSEQLNVQLKAAYDFTPTVKGTYTLGVWDLDSKADVDSYIKDEAGNPVYNRRVTTNGKNYDVSGFSPAETEALHIMQAIDFKSNTKGLFDWELTLSDYDYQKDKSASSSGTVAVGNPHANRTVRVTDLSGTGWTVFDAHGTLRLTDGQMRLHEIDFGYHVDYYNLHSDTNNTIDWSAGNKGSLFATSRGETSTRALFA